MSMNKAVITRAEERVMDILWESDVELNLPEIVAKVNEKYQTNLAPQTISTFLARLCKKGHIAMARSGRTFYYHTCISRDTYLTLVFDGYCQMFFDGDKKKLVDFLEKSQFTQK